MPNPVILDAPVSSETDLFAERALVDPYPTFAFRRDVWLPRFI